MKAVSEDTVTVTVDGRKLQARRGAFVLQVARSAGIEIPTLCDHPALEPSGACRLCVVEVTHPDWNGWRGLMTSCLYPVTDGIEVFTNSEAVREARRRVLALLAARCPNTPVIQELAARHGADTRWLQVNPDADDCILCGLCTRVCEAHATSAIGTAGRGAEKHVGPFAGQPPDECVGCGACRIVCPTGEIEDRRTGTGYEIWGRTFPTAVCVVDSSRCMACGACEEVCPFHVPRVTWTVEGALAARIPSEHCRGCGACVAACPSGAIHQEGQTWESLAHRLSISDVEEGDTPRVGVIACARATRPNPDVAGEAVVLEVPCAGRVTVPLLLGGLLQGLEGVLVLGRHQATCRFDGAEDPAVRVVAQAREVVRLLGMDPERVRFEDPAPGRNGPVEAVRAFARRVDGLERRGGQGLGGVGAQVEGLDTTLDLVWRLIERAGGRGDLSDWCAQEGVSEASGSGPVLDIGLLPVLDVLTRTLTRPARVTDLVHSAVEVLERLGIEVSGVTWRLGAGGGGTVFTLCPGERERLVEAGVTAAWIDDLLRERVQDLPRAPVRQRVACDGSDAAQVKLVEAMGYRVVDVGPDPLPDRFWFDPAQLAAARDRLACASAAGSDVLLTSSPAAWLRWGMLTRQGAWRTDRVAPVAGVQLAWLSIRGERLSDWVLERMLPGTASSKEETR